MRQTNHRVEIETRGKGLIDFTETVVDFVRRAKIEQGLLTLFCQHTSASLLIQENADPDVRTDLLRWFEDISPERGPYVHTVEGADDMPAHIRTALTQTHLSIPVVGGRPTLGTWQGIYLFEHRRAPHRRHVVLHLIGE